MLNLFNHKNSAETKLYNKILSLSRNKIFYTNFGLSDTFQNRINLIFLHFSFLNIKIKHLDSSKNYSLFFQHVFELMFKKIDQNMREVGYGDVAVNKKMKLLITSFYNILLKCEKYKEKDEESKNFLFSHYLDSQYMKKNAINPLIIDYFNKYEAFCFELSPDSVLKGDFNFKYEKI